MARIAYTENEIRQVRQHLVNAAMSLYLERGLESVTLRQVAERIGMSHTLVYRYFEQKEALFAEMRFECLKELHEALARADDPKAAPAMRLRYASITVLTFGCEQSAKYRLIFAHEQPSLDAYPRLREKREVVFAYCYELVLAAAATAPSPIDPLLLMHALWSLSHGMLCLHTAGQLVHGLEFDQIAMPLIDQMLQPFFAA